MTRHMGRALALGAVILGLALGGCSSSPGPKHTPTPHATPTPYPLTMSATIVPVAGATPIKLSGFSNGVPVLCQAKAAGAENVGFTLQGVSLKPIDYEIAIQITGYTGDGTYQVGAEVGSTRVIVTQMGALYASAQAASPGASPRIAALSGGKITVSDNGHTVSFTGGATQSLGPPATGYMLGTASC